jgi:hypothetical protein
MTGEELVKQAMRNPEFGVGHLEKWAEMLQILKDISANRMPTVADLLTQASQAPTVAMNSPSNRTMMAGQMRANKAGGPSEPKEGEKQPPSAIPQVVDQESSQKSPEKNPASKPSPSGSTKLSLRLPTTTVVGKSKAGEQPPPAEQKMEEAVTKQQDLLAEFEKIADELNRVLANLEGSTLVKRLKAASRTQYGIAGKAIDLVNKTFGAMTSRSDLAASKAIASMSEQEAKGSHDVSLIMDDMQSYFERRRFMQFKTVLDEMRKLDVVGNLRQLGDDLNKESGLSIAQCEYWSDTLDRWADDLVDPVSGGT